jgi:hypothetical protein
MVNVLVNQYNIKTRKDLLQLVLVAVSFGVDHSILESEGRVESEPFAEPTGVRLRIQTRRASYLLVPGIFKSGMATAPLMASLVALTEPSPFSNSFLARPKLRANFGMADPPNIKTATKMTTIKRLGPNISPDNMLFSFVDHKNHWYCDYYSPRIRRHDLRNLEINLGHSTANDHDSLARFLDGVETGPQVRIDRRVRDVSRDANPRINYVD